MRCADDDVVHAVAVDVARVGDRVAEQLARKAEVGMQDGAGATGTHVDMAGVRAGRGGVERCADDGVRRPVVVDVAKLAHRPAVALTGLVTGPGVYR